VINYNKLFHGVFLEFEIYLHPYDEWGLQNWTGYGNYFLLLKVIGSVDH